MESGNVKRKSRSLNKYWVIGLVFVVLIVLDLILWNATKNEQQVSVTKPLTTPIITLKNPDIKPNFMLTGLQSPTGIVSINSPTDKRLFVLERAGTIKIINDKGKLQEQPFLDIKQKVHENGEMGLLGLAFHPKYHQTGYFYVNYINKNDETVITRYKVTGNPNIADPASEKTLLALKQPYPNHNGGDLQFGKDGYLYIALGDGGSAGDPENRAQNKGELFGKILRIDVDNGEPYAVPKSNPFVNQTGVRPEIWAYGLRNPWRISFDKQTSELYIADVGQGALEEVDVQQANSKGGENYGWRCYEGSKAYKSDGCANQSSYIAPAFDYLHENGRCSITGGYVYRGKLYPALEGKYFYGDYCSGQIFYAQKQNNKWVQTEAIRTPYQISVFGQDSSGELYFADFKTGSIYKIEDAAN